MKKLIKSLGLFLCLLALASCSDRLEMTPSDTPAPSDTTVPSKMDALPFDDDHLYAVACLGYDTKERLSFYIENYLDDDDIPIHHVSNGEYYLIVPRYPDTAVLLYRNSIATSERSLFYESGKCGPFLIQCNISDIFPDVTIELTYGEESTAFSPYISLKDGSVMVGDRGLDITSPA